MNTFILTFGIFAIAMTVMAIGVIVNNRAIKGTCGGLNDIDGLEGACDICEVKEQCKRRRSMQRQALNNIPAFDEKATAFDEKATAFNQRATAFDERAMASNQHVVEPQDQQRSLTD